jgi:membrane peptidoglycan carboxypeptidase
MRWMRRAVWVAASLATFVTMLFSLLLVLTPSAGDAPGRAAAKIRQQPGTVPLTTIPLRIAAAVVATEDHRFYHHPGIDPIAFGRVATGLLTGRDRGGATIDAQLAKLLYTGDRHDWGAQLDVVGLAVKIDHAYSKDQILLMYLNVAYFGHGFYGAQAASLGYFGEPPQNLDWAQAALLAGLLQAPTDYDPLDHPQAALERRQYVLNRLVAMGALSSVDGAGFNRRGLELKQ